MTLMIGLLGALALLCIALQIVLIRRLDKAEKQAKRAESIARFLGESMDTNVERIARIFNCQEERICANKAAVHFMVVEHNKLCQQFDGLSRGEEF